MPESYKPGQRKSYFGENHKIGEERYAWVTCEAGKFLILVGEDKGHGPDVVFYHPQPGRLPNVSINLTNLTQPELKALADLFSTAVEWAQPVVTRRDKEAEDAWNQGDDSHSRNYRPVPVVVYRKRPESQHGEGLHDGPVHVSGSSGEALVVGEGGGDSSSGRDSERVRGAGDELAEPQPPDAEPEDDGTQID